MKNIITLSNVIKRPIESIYPNVKNACVDNVFIN